MNQTLRRKRSRFRPVSARYKTSFCRPKAAAQTAFRSLWIFASLAISAAQMEI